MTLNPKAVRNLTANYKRFYPYELSASGRYRLSRDGEEIITGTESECWTRLQNVSSASVSHSLLYEGYKMEPLP